MLEKAYGASIRGSWHIKNKLPNQDAYLIHHHKNYTLAVVCDGLGSKKHSRRGSKKLTKAFKREIKRMNKKQVFKFDELINKVRKRWRMGVFPFRARDCDTTCLFALIGHKKIFLGQIGDGLIAYGDGKAINVLRDKDHDFVNETESFHSSKHYQWTTHTFDKVPDMKYSVLLCTDGVSEDLRKEYLGGFLTDLKTAIGDGNNSKNPAISQLLIEWPNKYSMDDKTIVVVKPNG